MAEEARSAAKECFLVPSQEEEDNARSRRCCSAGALLWGMGAAGSAVLFLGVLAGLPVYLYLVKLPNLACPA
jgi:hypothetical protein